jgi:hypothetical protein
LISTYWLAVLVVLFTVIWMFEHLLYRRWREERDAAYLEANRKMYMEGVLHGYDLAARAAKEAESYRQVSEAYEEAFR